MRKKTKLIIIITLLAIMTCGVGITYSLFIMEDNSQSKQINIAKFIFDAKESLELNLPLSNLKPGDVSEYSFSVSNTSLNGVSKVLIGYQLTIKTYHFMPLNIDLYSISDNTETLLMSCTEDRTRNKNNELVCNGPEIKMGLTKKNDDYKIKVEFPSVYNTIEYANLVDFLSVEINSWQVIG